MQSVLNKAMLLSVMHFLLLTPVYSTQAMKEDNQHIRSWNKFANDILSLHKKLVAAKNIQVNTRQGGYANHKDFYNEFRYEHKQRLISKLQWEKENPNQLHTIEVYIHDKKGRVIRDYMAAYLPLYHNAPTQTLISFHHYNAELHAFRSFDASGDLIVERCSGKNTEGRKVIILLDEDELINDPDEVMLTLDYQQCFKGLKQTILGKYIIPQ